MQILFNGWAWLLIESPNGVWCKVDCIPLGLRRVQEKTTSANEKKHDFERVGFWVQKMTAN